MLLSLFNCYKFEESALDPTGTFSILRNLFSGTNGYTHFMINEYSAFRKAGIDLHVSYVRRTFGSSDDSRNRIDLIIGGPSSTVVIPTNVPMIGSKIASLVGYGYIPGNTSNKYFFLFEVTGLASSPDYYYWIGNTLPVAGSRMTFLNFAPAIAGDKIVGMGSYTVGAVEKIVFCEQSSSGSGACYNMNSDFTNRVAITLPNLTSCSRVIYNGSVGNCVDSITGSSYSFYSTSGGTATFGALPVTLVSNYKTAPYTTFLGNRNFYFEPDSTISHYVEHTANAARITSTPGDVTSLGALSSPGNSYQATVSAIGITDTDVLYPVRSSNGMYLSFLAMSSSGGTKAFHYRTNDFGVTWSPVSLAGLSFPDPSYPIDPTPNYMAALGFFATSGTGEKLHMFINKEGDALRRYVTADMGSTWTLQETIPLTSE